MIRISIILSFCGQPILESFPDDLNEASQTYNLEEELLLSLVVTESNCDNSAESSAGAIGYTQVMPNIWQEKALELDLDINEPRGNLFMGSYILSNLIKKYGEREALRRYIGYNLNVDGSFKKADSYASKIINRKEAIKRKMF